MDSQGVERVRGCLPSAPAPGILRDNEVASWHDDAMRASMARRVVLIPFVDAGAEVARAASVEFEYQGERASARVNGADAPVGTAPTEDLDQALARVGRTPGGDPTIDGELVLAMPSSRVQAVVGRVERAPVGVPRPVTVVDVEGDWSAVASRASA
jgi:hypothetical protein